MGIEVSRATETDLRYQRIIPRCVSQPCWTLLTLSNAPVDYWFLYPTPSSPVKCRSLLIFYTVHLGLRCCRRFNHIFVGTRQRRIDLYPLKLRVHTANIEFLAQRALPVRRKLRVDRPRHNRLAPEDRSPSSVEWRVRSRPPWLEGEIR